MFVYAIESIFLPITEVFVQKVLLGVNAWMIEVRVVTVVEEQDIADESIQSIPNGLVVCTFLLGTGRLNFALSIVFGL